MVGVSNLGNHITGNFRDSGNTGHLVLLTQSDLGDCNQVYKWVE